MAAHARRAKEDAPGGASLFVQLGVYQAVTAVRHVLRDVLTTLWFVLAVVGWELVVNRASPTTVQVLKSSGWLGWWTNEAMIPLLPALAAAAVFIMGLRTATRLVISETWRQFLLGYYGQFILYLLVLLVAIGITGQLPGGFLARYIPLIAAVYLSFKVRGLRAPERSGRLRRPTEAGFRPSRRSVCTIRGRVLLDTVDKAYPRGDITTNIAETAMHEAAAYFLRHRDSRTAAYCMARGIDYLLGHALFSDIEAILHDVAEDPRLAHQPALQAARARFLSAVGRREEAHRLLTAVAAKHQPPQLRMLVLESAIDLGSVTQSAGQRALGGTLPWSLRERLAALWRRQVAPVVLSLVLEARVLVDTEPDQAVELAYAAARMPERLLAVLHEDDSAGILHDLLAVRGLAFELAGDVASRRSDHPAAAAAYFDAYQDLTQQFIQGRRHLPRAARCLILAFVSAIRGGYDDPEQENHALDAIRAGLEILERPRGLLREEEDRARWIAERREVLDTVFDLITADVRWHRAKAGELGGWLLESLHRTLTADLLAAQDPQSADPAVDAALTQLRFEEARIRLPGIGEPGLSPQQRTRLAALCADIDRLTADRLRTLAPQSGGVDLADVYERLGNRVGLLYQCTRRAEGWRINAALVSREHGVRAHTALLPDPGPNPEISLALIPCGALDVLAAGDPEALPDLYYTFFGDPVWRDLAAALLPEQWWDALCPQHAAALEVVIVPDGPVAGLPFSALPVRDSRPLLEHAVTTLAPSLGALHAHSKGPHASPDNSGPLTVVTHLDEEQLHATFAELQQWRDLPKHLIRLVETATGDELERHLTSGDRPDIVSISVHGAPDGNQLHRATLGRFVKLRDGATLSTRTALRLSWPDTVLLAACWINAVDLAVGREPFGFPIACIRRGAVSVVGGIAPLPDRETAELMTSLIPRLPALPPAWALREAQLALSRRRPLAQRPVAAFACLTCWSVAAPRKPDKTVGRAAAVHWNADGTAVDGPVTSGEFDAEQLGHATRRILLHAQQRAAQRPVTTVDFLRSTFDADSEDWTAFLVACEIGAPEPPGTVDETAAGVLAAHTGEGDARVSSTMAKALHRAQDVRRALHDETAMPAHAVLAALLDPASGAHAWIEGHTGAAAQGWPQHLSDRIFHGDLVAPNALDDLEQPGYQAHRRRAEETRVTDAHAARLADESRWSGKYTALVLAVTLGFLPDNLYLLYSLQSYLHGRGQLGIIMNTAPSGGAYICAALPGGTAAAAGVQAGDIIRTADNRSINTAATLAALVEGHVRGAHVSLTIDRGGQTIHTTAAAEPLPLNPTPGAIGVSLADADPGAAVTKIQPGSAAQAAGIQEGDQITAVDGVPTCQSSKTAVYLLKYHNPGTTVNLNVNRNGRDLSVNVVMGPAAAPAQDPGS